MEDSLMLDSSSIIEVEKFLIFSTSQSFWEIYGGVPKMGGSPDVTMVLSMLSHGSRT
jgi:hypothetical protein